MRNCAKAWTDWRNSSARCKPNVGRAALPTPTRRDDHPAKTEGPLMAPLSKGAVENCNAIFGGGFAAGDSVFAQGFGEYALRTAESLHRLRGPPPFDKGGLGCSRTGASQLHCLLSNLLGGGNAARPTFVRRKHHKNEKSPEPFWLQGRIVDPRYHPAYLPGGRSLRTPASPIPVTGETVSHY